jgi:hypothetical protein
MRKTSEYYTLSDRNCLPTSFPQKADHTSLQEKGKHNFVTFISHSSAHAMRVPSTRVFAWRFGVARSPRFRYPPDFATTCAAERTDEIFSAV